MESHLSHHKKPCTSQLSTANKQHHRAREDKLKLGKRKEESERTSSPAVIPATPAQSQQCYKRSWWLHTGRRRYSASRLFRKHRHASPVSSLALVAPIRTLQHTQPGASGARNGS
ncbi:hypothetical protein SKAU_G00201550 [Synaphobranchus kaupii]|uniref:Uncharacterized protein n=1 Tax=Synaphobranchus kaupii TaxID=118154 RepID=A0A9Q1FFH7_SYNKA|nr:hypothetical protein SKAU_G00201550 [Synaphobranchus kaupii]